MKTPHSKPDNSDSIYNVMKDYCKTKQINLSDSELKFLSEDCYLFFESKNWAGVKYWPALAKRWVLNHVNKFKKDLPKKYQKEHQNKSIRQDKSIRQQILEQYNIDTLL